MSSGTEDFLYNAQTSIQSLYTQTADGVAQIQQTPAIKDTTSKSDVKNAPSVKYAQPPSNPKLVPPSANALPGAQGFDHGMMVLHKFPEMVLGAMNAIPVPTGEDSFGDELDKLLDNMSDEELVAIGQGDRVKGKSRLRFAVLHQNGAYPGKLASAANLLREQAEKASNTTLSSTLVAFEDSSTDLTYKGMVETIVRSSNLSDEEVKQVLFAYDVPEAKSLLPQKLQAILEGAEEKALTSLQTEVGLPDDWQKPRDTEFRMTSLAKNLTKEVEGEIYNLLKANKITLDEQNEMRTLLAYPSAETKNAAKLKPLLQSIVEPIASKLKADEGAPANLSVRADSASYSNMLNGTFFREFSRSLDKVTTLSEEQKAMLKKALASDEGVKELPEELTPLFETAKNEAMSALISTYNIPSTWKVTPSAMAFALDKTETQGYKFTQNAIDQVNEMLDSGNRIYDKINDEAAKAGAPPPPFAVLLKNYLKALSNVLISMQEMLSQNAVSDTNVANALNMMDRDSKLSEISKRKSDLKEVMDKQKKMASLGPLKTIFNWLIVIVITLVCPIAAVALLANSVIKNMTENKGHFDVSHMMKMEVIQDLTKSMQDIGKQIGGEAGKIFAKVAGSLSLVLLVALCPTALGFDMLAGDGTIFKEFLKAAGVNKDLAEKIGMGIQIGTQVIVAIALAVFTGGSSVMALTGKIGEAVGEIGLAAAQLAQKVMEPVVKFLEMLMQGIEKISKTVADALRAIGKWISDLVPDLIKKFEDQIQTAREHLATIADQQMHDTYKQLEEALKQAQSIGDKAEVERISQAMKEHPIHKAIEYSQLVTRRVRNISQAVPRMMEAGVTVHNNVLQMQIEKLKAAMEANRVIIEGFVEIIRSVVDNLLAAARGAGQDIKKTADNHRRIFEDLTQVITQLFQA